MKELKEKYSVIIDDRDGQIPSSAIIGKVGDAGGTIFGGYGNFYEVAPSCVEFKSRWGDIGSTETKEWVGKGKNNTQILCNLYKDTKKTNSAALKCLNFRYNNFSDWFLPSIDELDLMYKQLKNINSLDFHNEWYWSSSDLNIKNDYRAWNYNFLYGIKSVYYTNKSLWVRPVRNYDLRLNFARKYFIRRFQVLNVINGSEYSLVDDEGNIKKICFEFHYTQPPQKGDCIIFSEDYHDPGYYYYATHESREILPETRALLNRKGRKTMALFGKKDLKTWEDIIKNIKAGYIGKKISTETIINLSEILIVERGNESIFLYRAYG